MRMKVTMLILSLLSLFFFCNDTATTEIYTLSLHDALPISEADQGSPSAPVPGQGLRQRTGQGGGGGARLRCAHPQDRRGEARPRHGREALPGEAVGGGADAGLALEVPSDPGAL